MNMKKYLFNFAVSCALIIGAPGNVFAQSGDYVALLLPDNDQPR